MINTRKFELPLDELEVDWAGNNAAFTCPIDGCGKVYIVSATLHRTGRECPRCGQSKGFCSGGRSTGGAMKLQWRVQVTAATSR